MLAKTIDAEENRGASTLLNKGEHSISKSSLRRRKRKARDEIGKDIEAGRQGGVRELKDAVQNLEMELKEDDEEGVEGQRITKAKNADSIMSSSRGGKVTANQRKRVL